MAALKWRKNRGNHELLRSVEANPTNPLEKKRRSQSHSLAWKRSVLVSLALQPGAVMQEDSSRNGDHKHTADGLRHMPPLKMLDLIPSQKSAPTCSCGYVCLEQ